MYHIGIGLRLFPALMHPPDSRVDWQVRKRLRPTVAGAEQATPVQAGRAEAARLEQRLAALVNAAYGLTEEEVVLLWATAPPRMPVGPPEAD